MTNHEGEIIDNVGHLNTSMELLDDTNKIFELASVKTSKWYEAVDAVISTRYMCESIEECNDTSRYDLDADFSAKMSLRGEVSKISGSIGGTIASNTKSSLFTEPSITTMDNLDSSLLSILKPDELSAVIKTISVNQNQGPTPKNLAKL